MNEAIEVLKDVLSLLRLYLLGGLKFDPDVFMLGIPVVTTSNMNFLRSVDKRLLNFIQEADSTRSFL